MSATIHEYLAALKGKRVAVMGIGVSNTPLVQLLLKAGISVTACDKKTMEQLGDEAEELISLGAELRLGKDYLRDLTEDVIFRTPGMRPDLPELLRAKERGSVVTSEMEAFFEVCPCTLIGVTGSDGKTTTTTLIAEMLRSEGKRVHLGGNIGRPLLSDAGGMKHGDFAVLELSSFQLMTMERSPHIAVVTNLAPNHLDMHTSMEEYIAAKENIFTHQKKNDIAIFNGDNEITRGFAKKAPGRVRLFSRFTEPEEGVFLRGDTIWSRRGGKERAVLPVSGILIPGMHNVENYMAAIAATEGLVRDETVRSLAASFPGVEHRIELVRKLGGAAYYNDSIASSPSRTIAGLRSFPDKVILIAGGYDKHIPFDVLGPEVVRHVKTLVLTGSTAEKIRESVEKAPEYREGKPKIIMIPEFDEAVKTAAGEAKPGDTVILSPACASFDRFKNFAQRGEHFKKLVQEMGGSET